MSHPDFVDFFHATDAMYDSFEGIKLLPARSATDKVEEYNVLVHNTTPAPGSAFNSQPHHTVVTYASLNKTLSGDGADLTPDLSPGEVSPPPVPPPVSNSDLLAISGSQEPGQTAAAIYFLHAHCP